MKKYLIIPIIFLLFIPIIYSADCDSAVHLVHPYEQFDLAYSLAVGDLDGDGDGDIAFVDFTYDIIGWYNQTNPGVFATNITINSSLNMARHIVIYDVDEDGNNDIVSAGDAAVILSLNDGNGYFNDKTIASGTSIYAVDVGDLDGDGDIDIVICEDEDKLEVWLNDGSESFTADTDTMAVDYCSKPEIIDLDSDGHNDIVVGCGHLAGDMCLMWFENNGVGTFESHSISSAIDISDTDSGDMDGDGDIDIVTAAFRDFGQEALVWFENDGSEDFTQRNITAYGGMKVRTLEINDLDDDGDFDIIMSDENKISLCENDGDGNFICSFLTQGLNLNQITVGDVTEDDVDDVVFFERVKSFQYIDGIDCPNYPTGTHITECDFPSLFCDDFNYALPMSTQDWLIQLGGGVINNTFTPIDDELQLQNTQFISPYHETEAFETTYRPDSSSRFTRHIYSPVFSSQFSLTIYNTTDGGFKYAAYQTQHIPAYIIRVEVVDSVVGYNLNISYATSTYPTVEWKHLCSFCGNTGEEGFIKINTYFAQRDEFPFNTSVTQDRIEIYGNYNLIATIYGFLDNRTTYLSQYEFIKESEYNFTVDDYYVMVGTDKDISTMEQYYEDFYTDEDVINETVEVGTGTGDMATALQGIWFTLGLRSDASRIMAGLFLMFLLAIVMFGASISRGIQASATVVILTELFFMILLTYIRLLPIWLPFVIVLIAAGVGALVIKMSTAV